MKRFLSMLMIFVLVLSLSACGNSTPVKDNNGEKIPSGNENLLGGDDKEEKEPKNPEEINQDYADLIDTIAWAEAVCGVAYVGFFEGPSGDGYKPIIEESGLMEYYSFVAEIPSERFVETDGYDLYCIVPVSLDCSVKVEEVSLPENTEAWEPIIGATIYESETGEPILLKCNESDIFTNVLITITFADGTEKKISPYLSLMDGSLAGINEDESGLSAYDFTNYKVDCDDFYTFDELVGKSLSIWFYPDNENTYFIGLEFFYNEYDQQCVNFWYGLENSEIDEYFTGTVYENYDEEGNWDGGYTLDMFLTGGLFYESESYGHICSYKFQKTEDGVFAIHYGMEKPFFEGYEYDWFLFNEAKG